MTLDRDACYRALLARDARFDGVFFTGVLTTGIYCRPVCRARTPGRDRCVFFATGAEAEREGFRACFRCRPERAPGLGEGASMSRIARSLVARIEEGALGERDLESLARELGVSARHLRRCTERELGVSPIELALSRRLALARELLHGTTLPVTDIAFASGFGSVRRFNDAFKARHGRAPSELRRERARGRKPEGARLSLGYRAPYDWTSVLAFLEARCVAGVEAVIDGAYVRTVRSGERTGWIAVRPGRGDTLSLEVSPSLLSSLMPIASRARRLFDLDASPAAVDAHLASDPRLAPLVGRRAGLRVPGAFEPFETAMMAVLGQQVTVRAGVTLASRLVEALGEPVETPFPGVHRAWPRARAVAGARESAIAKLGMPASRARTVIALAEAVSSGRVTLDAAASHADVEAALLAVPGVGPWTAAYVLMRALAWPDAFPAGDVALGRALGVRGANERTKLAEAWRPWRSYAAMHLWTSLTGEDAHP